MTDEERIAIRKLYRAQRQVRASIGPQVPSQVVQAFLAVADNEGLTLTELADILGTNVSTASRQMLDLSDRNRKMEAGHNLISRTPDPMNLRVNRYTLTPKGRILIQELAETMKD
ncbi:MarR family transcriptional regulator [Novosphingobium barchaimii LL02]|uniref:MarR family transcriptional regulator n=1 Tax=Novosphingobium barchaimii LL02 TaxID=1114963 RepID=A0A0J8B1F8_9SPHN|nr:MarR family transcriptional regulator [Novosphingobium barchaimii]KMS60220.1 MarR family transcriptional regulator [Novosphingobium barchaimii LL02]